MLRLLIDMCSVIMSIQGVNFKLFLQLIAYIYHIGFGFILCEMKAPKNKSITMHNVPPNCYFMIHWCHLYNIQTVSRLVFVLIPLTQCNKNVYIYLK